MTTVVNIGKSTLIVEEEDTWNIPLVNFSIIFDSNPNDTLKYGPNGLHLAEHVLWNMISMDYSFIHTNASTYSTGEMWVYGDAYMQDYEKALKSFFDGLIKMTKGKMIGKLKDIYHVEQKRVTAETNFMHDGYVNAKMFTYNSDILRNEYPPDYVWRILLNDTKLVRIFVQTQSTLSESELKLFDKKATEFEEAWKVRTPGKESLLPLFYAPSLSMMLAPREPGILISLDSIENPIEKDIILHNFSSVMNDFNFKGTFFLNQLRVFLRNRDKSKDEGKNKDTGKGKDKDKSKNYPETLRIDRFFFSIRLASEGPVKVEWVKDLVRMTEEEIVTKYRQKALDHFATLAKKYVVEED
jgi:hypothetical protein